MNDRFFVLMQAMSGNDRHETRFEEYHSLAEAEAMVQGWMSRYMAVDCIPHDQVEAVRAENGGILPEMMFPCPKVEKPQDLMDYNGYYNLGGLGLIFHVFLTVVDDEASALRFRGVMNREFRIDTEYSDRADKMLRHLNNLVSCFQEGGEEKDITEDVDAIRDFWKRDGFNPFEVPDTYFEIEDNSLQYTVADRDMNWVSFLD
ncbi:MAG: hypothetical protein IJE03_00535 [Ruminiclostridium sp.]|nr:hypothetical protein [Ruminiclostridium sp.]MBQ9852681.1 hypothetical protein [Ruminiclostridium sp.]